MQPLDIRAKVSAMLYTVRTLVIVPTIVALDELGMVTAISMKRAFIRAQDLDGSAEGL